jgi:hypothetical protein
MEWTGWWWRASCRQQAEYFNKVQHPIAQLHSERDAF